MIKNERQYRITKAQAGKFAASLEELVKSKRTNGGETHPLLLKAEEDALRSQLEDLKVQIEEYDALRSERVAAPHHTFELYLDSAGEYRWRLRHKNGNIIADSAEGFSSKANALNDIESWKENAAKAPILDLAAA